MNRFFPQVFAPVITLCIFATNGLSGAEFVRLGIPDVAEESWARSVSDDGSVVAGLMFTNREQSKHEAFRWTESTGVVGLGFLAGDDRSTPRSAQSLSGDGSTIVGNSGVFGNLTKGFIHISEII